MGSRKGVDQMTDEKGSWKAPGRRFRNEAGYNKLQAQQNNVPRGSCAPPSPRGSRGNVRPPFPSSIGKARLEYNLQSYQEKVVNGQKQTCEENQKLAYFKDKPAKEKKHSQTIKNTNVILAETVRKKDEELRKKDEEIRIFRQRSKVQVEEFKEQMDYIEEFYKNQLKLWNDERVENEESFEMSHQEERQKVKQSKEREDEFQNIIKSQDEYTEVFVGERDELMKIYEEKKAAPEKRNYEDEVELENEIHAQLTQPMDKFSPHYLFDT